jgi:hypothetical protein
LVRLAKGASGRCKEGASQVKNATVMLDVDQLAAIVIEREGFDPADQETVVAIRQRCMMAMYRYVDKGQVVKERWGSVRVWRLA